MKYQIRFFLSNDKNFDHFQDFDNVSKVSEFLADKTANFKRFVELKTDNEICSYVNLESVMAIIAFPAQEPKPLDQPSH